MALKYPFLQSSDIKHKYFYRTEKWSWLSLDQIQIIDSKSPRMVTMDPWPQQVYLDASGQKTVEAYIHDFAEMYPPNEVPPELDKVILEVLEKMVNDGGLIRLADQPEKLDFELHKPSDDTTSIDLRGKWTGHYSYRLPKGTSGDQWRDVEFTMSITHLLGQKFYGTIEDNTTTGGTPGIGKIEGALEGKNFHFEKMMPIYSGIDEKGQRFRNEAKNHPTLLYNGSFSEAQMNVIGTWRFKEKVTIKKWGIPIKVSAGNGGFEMQRVDTL